MTVSRAPGAGRSTQNRPKSGNSSSGPPVPSAMPRAVDRAPGDHAEIARALEDGELVMDRVALALAVLRAHPQAREARHVRQRRHDVGAGEHLGAVGHGRRHAVLHQRDRDGAREVEAGREEIEPDGRVGPTKRAPALVEDDAPILVVGQLRPFGRHVGNRLVGTRGEIGRERPDARGREGPGGQRLDRSARRTRERQGGRPGEEGAPGHRRPPHRRPPHRRPPHRVTRHRLAFHGADLNHETACATATSSAKPVRFTSVTVRTSRSITSSRKPWKRA